MTRDEVLLTEAWREALQAAWSEAVELMTRREPACVPDLLRGRAAELSRAGLAKAQLDALALDAVADAVESGAGRAAAETGLGPVAAADPDRAALRQRVAALSVGPEVSLRARAARVEAGADAGRRVREGLARHAALNRLLWDHPALPADDATRLVMLCAVEALEDALATAEGGGELASARRGLVAAWARWRGLQ